MYKRGCLLVNPTLIADPEIFEALCEAFTIIRQLEVNEGEHIVICEHPEFLEANEGEYLPFYDPVFERKEGFDFIDVKEIGAPYIHTKYFLQCQNQAEAKKEETDDSLIWLPEQ
jgi:hypothetical protein